MVADSATVRPSGLTAFDQSPTIKEEDKQMARPKKETPPKKEYQITLRMTKDLYDVLTADAKAARLPRTEYIRQLITNRHPIVKQEVVYDSEELLHVFRNLGNISGTLNQIARHLNFGGKMTNDMWKEVSGCIAQILHMRDQIKEMAGEYRGNS